MFSALMTAILNITGMDALGITASTLWFGRLPDRASQPPGCLISDPQGRDPLIQDAEFEVDQFYWFNPLVEYWNSTLSACEAWANLMDDEFSFEGIAVAGFTVVEEGIEIGRVRFEKEPPRDVNANLIHKCIYPMRIPLMKEAS